MSEDSRISRYDWMEAELSERESRALYREMKNLERPPKAGELGSAGKWLYKGGKRLYNLSSNNYLGLSGDPRIAQAASRAQEQWGAGATASRLVCGNHGCYRELEEDLAAWKGREAALVFANGYMANLGVISALMRRGDAVFSDRLNHASIVDGIILSRADHFRYRHNDLEHLEFLLKKHDSPAQRKLIVTDAVFSMDGDAAPLHQLVELRNRYGALLMVDEAHSGGIRGPHGEGLCHEYGLHEQVDVIMGTFSKAFGVYGAYVCADRVLIEYLVNASRPLIYSTGLPPMVVAAAHEALRIVRSERERREKLRELSAWFRQQMHAWGLPSIPGESPIIPWLIGDNARALQTSSMLAERGISAVAIRPPTVPDGEARIRFSLMATHTRAELARALESIRAVAGEVQEVGR
ncbi:8-amino-7-oxononanoate synthase [Brevibacillus ruminantium]|uniref:8-amino-7-ketopelargonate synthase n=1 Tax=Brevibacillus ruminantium TaxID=2950604 RepID=A0ABY4WED7_9BACL|nr:8-amino-7-oxononanoate synthase [Brevibacillus ruminantium]USG65418.1 8-amino-7-oxononanoate synthase [Brevibacillus ruminantium]